MWENAVEANAANKKKPPQMIAEPREEEGMQAGGVVGLGGARVEPEGA